VALFECVKADVLDILKGSAELGDEEARMRLEVLNNYL
jgi:hypothetical protein